MRQKNLVSSLINTFRLITLSVLLTCFQHSSLQLRPQRGLTEKNISQKADILACYLGEKRQEDCETHKY